MYSYNNKKLIVVTFMYSVIITTIIPLLSFTVLRGRGRAWGVLKKIRIVHIDFIHQFMPIKVIKFSKYILSVF